MENCEGCGIINNCGVVEYKEADKCPCSICLIKGICYDKCDNYADFLIHIWRIKTYDHEALKERGSE